MTSIFNSTAKLAIVASLGLATLIGAASPASAQPRYDRGTNGVTTCAAPGGRQEAGAVVGAILGAVVGRNFTRGEPTAGAVGGAVVGGAIGAGIGCESQHERERREAYNGYNGYDGGRYSDGIAPARYERTNQWVVAEHRTTLRQAPSQDSGRVGTIRGGERLQAVGIVRGGQWILIADHGQYIGYVRGGDVQPLGQGRYAYND